MFKDFKGFTLYEKWFFSLFLILQCFVFVLPLLVGETQGIGKEAILNLIASISGVVCVFMAAKGRLSTYFFGVIQVCTYGYLSFKAHFMGEVGMQVIFLIFQFIGLVVWWRHMKQDPEVKNAKVKEVDDPIDVDSDISVDSCSLFRTCRAFISTFRRFLCPTSMGRRGFYRFIYCGANVDDPSL